MRYFKHLFTLTAFFYFAALCCAEQKFTIISASFKDNSLIPAKYAMTGSDAGISPQLRWEHAPAGTRSFVIACVDIHPIASHWIHWMVINIPASVNSLPEKASLQQMPKGAVELQNSFKALGYGGPNPPRGSGIHDYIFTIYALDIKELKTAKSFLTQKELLTLLSGNILAQASIAGKYSR